MQEIIHKITGYINKVAILSAVLVILYGLYVIWTRDNTNMTKMEIRILLTSCTFFLLNFAVYVYTD
jgi:hypothetical protein